MLKGKLFACHEICIGKFMLLVVTVALDGANDLVFGSNLQNVLVPRMTNVWKTLLIF
jgi:hypothetical protein